MTNMWSKNKYVDILINSLIFLLSMNFLHYGQLLLPVICLIIFISNKMKFYVSNIKVFVILCLFSISFCFFSYKLGFYCVMGFCIPMAYYIGSNINTSEDNIKKLVYIIAFGMAAHLLLNFIYEISIRGLSLTGHSNRYDIWLQDKVTPTGIATNMCFIFSLFYFLLIKEKNKIIKIIGAVLLVISMIYELIVGRRAQLFMIVICLAFSILFDIIVNKGFSFKVAKRIVLILLLIVAVLSTLFYFDFLSIRSSTIVQKFVEYGLYSGRLDIFLENIKLVPFHLFGGQEISNITGNMFHDLLFDIYDYAGIITFIFMFIYVICSIKTIIQILKNKKFSNDTKLFVSVIALVSMLQFVIEPIITGSSIFLICFVIIEACLEKNLVE